MALLQNQKSLNLLKLIRLFSIQKIQAVNKPESLEDEWKNAKPHKSIPTMSKFTILRRFLPGGMYHNISLIELHKKMRAEFGDILTMPGMFGRNAMVSIYNPEDIEKIFRNEGHYPHRRALETLVHYRLKMRPDVYGEYGGLLNDQGESWQRFRTMINPIMVKPQTVKLYIPQIDEIAQDFLKMISKIRDDNNEVPANFSDYVNQWGLESITCITLNRRLGLLNENYHDENAQKLIKLIRKFFEKSYGFEVNPAIWKYYETKSFKELLQVYDGMTELVLQFVNEAIEKLEKEPPKDEKEQSILEKLLKINKKVAVVMSADSMVAGVDTTASAFISILYCLAKNQDKQDILRAEMEKILPDKKDPLTAESLRSLPYLRSVIKEGLRLYSPTTGNIRRIDRDLVLSGYQVPKHTDVIMGILLASNDDENFARAKEFIPERWLKENTDPQCPHAKDSNPFAYLPFGFGARMCVGRRLAELELESLLIRTIRNYKVEWNYPDMKIKSVLVNIPDGDLKFKFTEI